MWKSIKTMVVILLVAGLVYGGTLLTDREMLRENLVRLHVVGASNSAEDQQVKLVVRDAVLESVQCALQDVTDAAQAKQYIQNHLPQIQQAANDALAKLGIQDRAAVTLTKEAFPTRVYETFSLPSGVYESLRVVIGPGEGRNWWCVVFPGMCLKATADGVKDVAAGAGFSDALTDTVTGQQGYEIRFYLLDMLGKLENFMSHR